MNYGTITVLITDSTEEQREKNWHVQLITFDQRLIGNIGRVNSMHPILCSQIQVTFEFIGSNFKICWFQFYFVDSNTKNHQIDGCVLILKFADSSFTLLIPTQTITKLTVVYYSRSISKNKSSYQCRFLQNR